MSPTGKRTAIVVVLALACLGIAAGAFALLPKKPEFDQAVMEGLKQRITDELNKTPGVSVIKVNMIRESARRTSGFVEYRLNGEVRTDIECLALMEEGTYSINLNCRQR